MTRLGINGDALHSRARTMRTILGDFSTIGNQADSAADAVGQAVLASTLKDFASNWSIHRSRTVEALTGLADAFDAVNQTFADLESNLAAQLREATAQVNEAVDSASTSSGRLS